MAGHQTTFVNYDKTFISSWSHNQNSQKHIWKRFKCIEIISKHCMIAQSEDNIKNRKSELCICCVFWFCKIGTLENRRNCNILMGQSGPKINPVWAGDTVAKHGPVTVTSEFWVTVHRALLVIFVST